MKYFFFVQAIVSFLPFTIFFFLFYHFQNEQVAPSFYFAIAAGLTGAALSSWTDARKIPLDQFPGYQQWTAALLWRSLAQVGFGTVVGAGIYFLFFSGLIAGELFPNFVDDKNLPETSTAFQRFINRELDESIDWAKLLFWCFAAANRGTLFTTLLNRVQKDADPVGEQGAK